MEREPAKHFQDLIVLSACNAQAGWQKAHLSGSFPSNEIYELTSQVRRAAISIPANIAEGFKKRTKPDKVRYMNIAQASLEECRYYLVLAKDLGYGDTSRLMPQLEEVSKLLETYTSPIPAPDFWILASDFWILDSGFWLLTSE